MYVQVSCTGQTIRLGEMSGGRGGSFFIVLDTIQEIEKS